MKRIPSSIQALSREAVLSALSLSLCLLLLITLLPFLFPTKTAIAEEGVSAQRDATRVVTVAYFQYGNFMSLDEEGDPVGFTVDYLNEISSVTKWHYEYIYYHSVEEAITAARNGEVDILPALNYTDERTQYFLYTNTAMCETNSALYVNAYGADYAYEDFESFDGMTVGALKASHDIEVFENYCMKNGFKTNIVEYPSTADMVIALENGVIDAATSLYLGGTYDYRIVARFNPDPLYFTFPLDRKELANEFNEAISSLSLRDPEYSAKLYKKYFGINTDQDPVFTREENEYIAKAPKLKVVYDSSRAPLSYSDQTSGEFSGAISNLFSSIENITGLEFEYIPVDNHIEGIEMVRRGEADIIYSVDENLDGNDLLLTSAYLNDPMAKVVGSSKSERLVAVPEGYWLTSSLVLTRHELDFKTYATPRECLDAVLKGQADVAYLDLNVAIYQLSNPSYESLRINTLTNFTNDMCIGVSKSTDPRLVSILDRCVQFTSGDLISRWISESSLANTPLNLMDIARQNPLAVIGIFAALFIIALIIIIVIARSRIQNNRRIAKMTYTDPLTGGWNFSRFQVGVHERLKGPGQKRYALFYFDFAHFKSFNAIFGFAEGDELLISTQKLLGEYAIGRECYAHISADEYVVLMEWEDWNAFLKRFDRFDSLLNDLPLLRDRAYKIIIIGGIYLVEPSDNHSRTLTISDMIDCARYARESIGNKTSKSKVALYNDEMKEKDIAERRLFSEAEAALQNGEFVAYYQPKVEIATERIVGFEALARWISPTEGIRQPATFIPLFEQNGFVRELDFYIFELVCKRIRAILDSGEEPVPISCNFSRHHLRKNDLPEKLKALVDRYDIPTQYLELELTENLVIEDFDRALEICQRLKAYGFPISIDDFGSGYSSLGTLQSLPIDVLKLDRSFLMADRASDTMSSRETTILVGIIQIANHLGIKVVVEGVETIHQAEMLLLFDEDKKEKGGIVAQGYLYSKPVSLIESMEQFRKAYLPPLEN